MSTAEHDAVVRHSFEQQTGLFSGEGALFARRDWSALSWVEPLEPDMIVLDVACGAAHAAEQIAPHVRQVVGIDLTPALLTLAADRLQQAGVPNVLLQEGNAAALPFLDESFDLVVCRAALHHFADPEQTVAEMARVCRPTGRVAVVDMIAPSAEERDAFDDVHRRIDPSHAGALLEAELAELLRAQVGPLTYAETTPPFNVAVEHMLTDAADRDAVRAALDEDLRGGAPTGLRPARVDDGVHVSITTTVVHATRAPA
ncbi:MAG TPA: methyltransferase domain-containing protein [Acidimicrobiia bacterium]|jgi:ubiquinone/menaquinone biosynthesis C-methylase UbiE|nr:methyltransferase domain-containing protein [Acidimicrobiia bacterium]